MRLRIYQIDPDKDQNRVKFRPFVRIGYDHPKGQKNKLESLKCTKPNCSGCIRIDNPKKTP